MRPYDPADNDTYVERFSRIPARDIEIHMFRNKDGVRKGSVCMGGVMGDFTAQSAATAADKVLRFATAKSLGLTLIKKAKLKTPLPMSLVERYEIKVSDIEYAQQVPVFYDSRHDQFVLLLDSRFLRDVSESEFLGALQISVLADRYRVYRTKDREPHLGICYSTFAELAKDNSAVNEEVSPYALLRESYARFMISSQDGQKVILVRYVDTSGDAKHILPTRPGINFNKAVLSAGMRLEVSIAFLFSDRYYVSDDGQTISQSKVIFLDKQMLQRAEGEFGNGRLRIDEDPGLLVLPYSDEQYALLTGMVSRLTSLNKELCGFFNTFVSKGGALDVAISPQTLPGHVRKLLEHGE